MAALLAPVGRAAEAALGSAAAIDSVTDLGFDPDRALDLGIVRPATGPLTGWLIDQWIGPWIGQSVGPALEAERVSGPVGSALGAVARTDPAPAHPGHRRAPNSKAPEPEVISVYWS